MNRHAYSDMVRAYEKSVGLGGTTTLFPVPESLVQAFVRNIRDAMRRAEDQAYACGRKSVQDEIRKAMQS